MNSGTVRRIDNPVYAFLSAAATPVLVVTDEGMIDYLNPAADEAFGYQPEELYDQPVELLVPGERSAAHVEQRVKFMKQTSGRPLGRGRELGARRKDGSVFPAEISLTQIKSGDRTLVVASVIDITARLADLSRMTQISGAYLTLAEMNWAIIRAPDAQTLFDQTCQISVAQGGYLGAWVGKRGDDSSVNCVAVAGTFDEYVAELRATTDPADARGRGPTGRVMREGTSYFGQDFLTDEATRPWARLGATWGIKATATLPLRCAGQVVATLTLYSDTPHVFTEEVRSLLEGMADNVSFALDGFDAAAKLRAFARERAELSGRLVAAQEAERARIAADVHDESVQALAILDLRLGLLKRHVVEGGANVEAMVDDLHRSVGVVSTGLRDLLFELEPAAPGSQLLSMVEEAAAHVFSEADIRCAVTPDLSGWDRSSTLSQTDRGQALRIVKEALFNARKHSGASHVVVRVSPQAQGVEVEIEDDGTGFDADSDASAPGHRGMANMRDRASVSGGWCRITSGTGGTSVRFWMPYDASAEPWDGPIS